MKHGFLKVSCCTLPVFVADCAKNAAAAADAVRTAAEEGVQILVLPELCLTGATCGDLFLQKTLLDGAVSSLESFLAETADTETLTAVGLPMAFGGKVYDCAAVCQSGRILGIVPRTAPAVPFAPAPDGVQDVTVLGETMTAGQVIGGILILGFTLWNEVSPKATAAK